VLAWTSRDCQNAQAGPWRCAGVVWSGMRGQRQLSKRRLIGSPRQWCRAGEVRSPGVQPQECWLGAEGCSLNQVRHSTVSRCREASSCILASAGVPRRCSFHLLLSPSLVGRPALKKSQFCRARDRPITCRASPLVREPAQLACYVGSGGGAPSEGAEGMPDSEGWVRRQRQRCRRGRQERCPLRCPTAGRKERQEQRQHAYRVATSKAAISRCTPRSTTWMPPPKGGR
jgi:hypothetical protein